MNDMENDCDPNDAKELGKRLQTLWSSLNSGVWHGMSCRCCGGGMFALSSATLELDIIDHLADRYDSEGLHELKAALNARAESADGALPSWLNSVRESGKLSPALVHRLQADVADMLEKMQTPRMF